VGEEFDGRPPAAVEGALIAGILAGDNLGNEEMAELIMSLAPADFAPGPNRWVAEAIRTLHEAGQRVDHFTVGDYLDRIGRKVNTYRYNDMVVYLDTHSLRSLAQIVRSQGVRRRKREAALALARVLSDGGKGLALAEWRMRAALEEQETLDNRVEHYEAHELCDVVFPAEADLWGDGILTRKSACMISAYAKSYKTMLALNLAIALAGGADYLGFHVPEPVRVLYVQGEVSMRNMQARIQTMLRERAPVRGNLVVVNWRGEKLTTRTGYESMVRLIQEHHPTVVMIDPLYKVHTFDENKSAEMVKLTSAFDWLIERHGITLVLVHHHGKHKEGTGKLSPERIRGSSTMFDYVDTSIRMTRSEDEPGQVKLAFTLRNNDDPPDMTVRMNANLWFHRTDHEGALREEKEE